MIFYNPDSSTIHTGLSYFLTKTFVADSVSEDITVYVSAFSACVLVAPTPKSKTAKTNLKQHFGFSYSICMYAFKPSLHFQPFKVSLFSFYISRVSNTLSLSSMRRASSISHSMHRVPSLSTSMHRFSSIFPLIHRVFRISPSMQVFHIFFI